jgi:hypothetical protein
MRQHQSSSGSKLVSTEPGRNIGRRDILERWKSGGSYPSMKLKKLGILYSVLTLGAAIFCSCSVESDPSHAAAKPKLAQDAHVVRVWEKQEKIMEDALAGRPYSIEEFGAACDFFTRLTGIEIRGNGSFFGWLPNEETAIDFKRVEEWYAANRDRLYWDEASKSVKAHDRKPSGARRF